MEVAHVYAVILYSSDWLGREASMSNQKYVAII